MSTESFPLTQSQLAIWLGQQLYPDVPLYNMVHLFQLGSEIDVNRFKEAFQLLVNNTESLRLIFDQRDGEPSQSILKEYNYDLPYEEYSYEEWNKLRENWIDQRRKLLLSLDKPLFDSALIRVGSDQYLWYLNIHHLVTDATSSTLYLDFLSEIYVSLSEDPELKTFKIPSYRAFADFEREQVNYHQDSNVRRYWDSQLELDIPQISLYGRNFEQHETASNRLVITLDESREAAIQKLLSNKELQTWNKPLTEFIFYTTVLFSFLFKISNEDKVAIGAPTHNRNKPDFKRTPGLFIEIFPIIGELRPNDSFLSLYQRIRQETFEYLKHAQTGTASPAISGSFQIMINYIHSNFGTFNGTEVTSEWIHPDHIDPAHMLRCSIYAMDNQASTRLLFDLNNAVFEKDISNLFSEQYLNLLDQILSDIDQPLDSISIISEAEESWMTAPVNYEPFESIILESIHSTAQEYGQQLALRSTTNDLSYSELDQLSGRLTANLISKGARPGDRIGLYFPRCAEYIVSILAVMKLGATFVPLATNQSSKRVSYMISDANCTHILSLAGLVDSFAGEALIAHKVDLSELRDQGDMEFDEPADRQATEIAYILYTSGSTGRPKGVRISLGALNNYLGWAEEYYKLSERPVYPLFTSIGFDLTITSIFLPLMSAGQIIIYDESETGPDLALLDVIDDNEVNAIKLTPSHMALLETKDLKRSQIKLIIAGGEELSTVKASNLLNGFSSAPRLINEYGPTEATVGCVVHEFDPGRQYGRTVPIGRAIANMETLVLNQSQKLVPRGVPGELYLSGLSLSDGYINQEKKTEENFISNPLQPHKKMYKTGDWVRWNSRHELEFLGRKDDQIKFHGYRIELTDIEWNITEFDGISQAAVLLVDLIDRPSEAVGTAEEFKLLVAYYTASQNISTDELRLHLMNNLPEYMIPSKFVKLESLPLTANGKLNRDQLKLVEIPEATADMVSISPRNDIEEMLFEIWKDVLGDQKFGVKESFINLGGHSLTAIRITTRINEELGLQFPLIKIFELPTIEQYAIYVEQTLVELMDS